MATGRLGTCSPFGTPYCREKVCSRREETQLDIGLLSAHLSMTFALSRDNMTKSEYQITAERQLFLGQLKL